MAKGPPPESRDDELAAAIHETTNMLTVVMGWLTRAREACEEIPAALEAVEHAARYTRTARTVMRRAIGATVPPVPPDRADVVARRAVEDLSVAARDKGVVLRLVDPDDPALSVPAPDVVWQILTNLLLNAIQVTSKGGLVQMTWASEQDAVVFRISDSGPGIDDHETVFSGHSRRAGGAGIGLRHARSVADLHDGSLTIVPSDSGACFELRWPGQTASAPPDAAPISEKPRSRSLASRRVLLLEDDPAIIELLELSLRGRGAHVTVVEEAEALFSELEGGDYDTVLMDLSPLEGDLDMACVRARATNPEVNIVVISGSVTVQPREDIVWVRKPFEPGELVRAIGRSWRE